MGFNSAFKGLKKEKRAITLLPLWAFVASYKVTFTFTHYFPCMWQEQTEIQN